ncbi:mitochondrial import inner membrane translocase subunit Tim29 [Alligator mississippiensis]|uniref:Mitochondrial import inner membrane translocase subunit Tim29 n=1 Tax=Alligator mississippiensis TaxID=8496 RepID=A0A151NV65_ALLMI|nr:mitochondrial import inner membrane translocase subunit Tim29 [Alligator mississippiensis]KYO40315.1 hypothetical protein Y1Q_0008998 [Alligator mississippiensis]
MAVVADTTSGAGLDRGGRRGFWGRLGASRLGQWWKSLLHDYVEACKEVVVGARQRPGKAGLYLSVLAGAAACSLRIPSDTSFDASLLEASGTLLLLSPWVCNTTSKGHVQRLMQLRNWGQLRYQSLVFFSLVYEAPFDAETDLYLAQCKHLQPRWTEFPGRILDVGFWGRWWVLNAKMKDSDINDEEFQNLPEQLRIISFQNLHSETNERLFGEKYKPVVLTEEQIEQAEREMQPLPQGVTNQ